MNFDADFLTLIEDLLEYQDGDLYWKQALSTRVKVGNKAGSIQTGGYIGISVLGRKYGAHKLVYLLHHKTLPKFVDHIDGNRLNNRIENLRACTRTENNQNTSIRSHNSSGVKNVTWHCQTGKWRVIVRCNGVPFSFGLYKDLEFAELVASAAREKLHGQFASHR